MDEHNKGYLQQRFYGGYKKLLMITVYVNMYCIYCRFIYVYMYLLYAKIIFYKYCGYNYKIFSTAEIRILIFNI